MIDNETLQYKSLLKFDGDDFEVWESNEYGTVTYHVDIEGYMGYEKFESFIELFQNFLNHLGNYLIKNNYSKTKKHIWKCLYQTRAISICHEAECYWVFLEPYKTSQIWDIYYYIEDIIIQLKEVARKINKS